ncbi:MAG TPA: ankyrin repeat domain-containing protein [Vicinamibacterales bacterium]|nr:ankyrin repeat domain-containing protein [Vicinamibacterales bacterium]
MKTTRSLQVALVLCLAPAIVAAQSAAPVADAAKKGDIESVRTLLKQGADVSAALGDGMSALHWAAERADLAMAEMLVYGGANVDSVTRIGAYTPLHLAAKAGSAPVVLALLKVGANASARSTNSGVTPLHLAAGAGSVQAVTALLDKGADVNAREGEWQQTPLIFAASQNRVDVINLLIKRGADVKAVTKTVDLGRQQATDRAAVQLQRRIIEATVPKGQEPTASQQQAAVQAAREFYATGKMPDLPAPAAAGAGGGRGGGGRGGPPAGAPQNAGNAPGGGQAGQGAGGAAAGLNEDGPAPAITAKGGMTALHHAARQGYVKAATALLDAGADLNQKSADGNTPLLIALVNGQFDVAMLFVEKGAKVNIASDGLGITPLWATINTRWQPRTRFPQPQEMELQKATYLDVMKAVLEAGADPDARIRVHPWYMVYTGCGNGNCGLTNTVGSTAFWRAAYGTDVDAMKLLMKYGADPNIPTMAPAGRGGGGRGGAAFGGRGGGGGPNPTGEAAAPPAPRVDPSGLPTVPTGGPGVFALHAAAGVEYGEGFAGNAHRHAPEGWMPAVKYLIEELGADVNQRDNDGYTALHHAAARGDNEMILYLVSKGADVKAVSRNGRTTADMANGPVSRISPFPETIALLVKLGAVNNNRCQSCAP